MKSSKSQMPNNKQRPNDQSPNRRKSLFWCLVLGSCFLFVIWSLAFGFSDHAAAQQSDGPQLTSFPTQDGGLIYAHEHGKGQRGVVLAHGARFNKESWEKQARALAKEGFRVLAIDFRGYGKSKGPEQKDVFKAPLHYDVLAAVRYLHKAGAKSVSVLGASMGAGASADASIESKEGEIDRLILLAGWGSGPAEKLKGRKLFAVARDDLGPGDMPRLATIRKHYEKAGEPKELLVLEGSAHAQALFETDQGERLMREIIRFLSAK